MSRTEGVEHETCPGCGYDLSATRRGGLDRCPECGWTVQSARGRLDRARRWLDGFDRWLTVAAIVVVAIVVLIVVLVFSGP